MNSINNELFSSKKILTFSQKLEKLLIIVVTEFVRIVFRLWRYGSTESVAMEKKNWLKSNKESGCTIT